MFLEIFTISCLAITLICFGVAIIVDRKKKKPKAQPVKKTPTEMAFEKAKHYDAIVGYFRETWLEKNACTVVPNASNRILDRYQIERDAAAAEILGYLESTFTSNDKRYKFFGTA